ncbi:ubiquinol-cytochrome c reductase core subunit 1 [Elasticomyces elasticus]|nr:ubiquinol-cytochrome c reductase core subunit 1 [Elasticomyces elasticus]
MISRSAIGTHAARALRRRPATLVTSRGLAAPASGSFQYETGEASGVKFASRDLTGPTTTLALVAKAGTRYQPLPGLTEGLQRYAFRSTERRSALRIQRESELLGSELLAYHSRENLVVGAKFLRDDLPYFVELIAEVAQQTKYLPYTFHEEIIPLIQMAQKKYLASTKEMAINSAHGLAFHRGLGVPLFPSSSTPVSKYLDADAIADYASTVYSKPMFSVVANGAEHSELSRWVNEFFTDAPTKPSGSISEVQTKYFGGEERIAHGSGNTMVLAFPGSSTFTGGRYKPEIAVLAALLGGQTSIKWSPGFSLLSKAGDEFLGASITTSSAIYSDAGLLTITIHGSAKDVRGAASKAVQTIKTISSSVSKDDFQKAKALAKFKELEFGENVTAAFELTGAGLVQGGKAYQLDETAKAIDAVTQEQVTKAAKTLLDSKASVASVGDLYILPYAEEIGLKV